MKPNIYRWYPDKDKASLYIALNDANYKSRFLTNTAFFGQTGVDIKELPRTNRPPARASKKWRSRSLVLVVHPKGAWRTQVDELHKYFNTHSLTLGKLAFLDEDDGNREWIVYADVEDEPKAEPGGDGVQIRLRAYDPIWKSASLVSTLWNITASGDTFNVTPGGNNYARPIFKIKPTAAKTGGIAYRIFRAWHNPLNVANPARTIDLTNNAWDHAAEVAAGQAQADGDDIVVYVDGRKAPRWIEGNNTTTCQVFVTLDFDPQIKLTLEGSIAASGAITEINFEKTSANYAGLRKLATKRNYMIIIGTEIFTFTQITPEDFQVGGTITRAAKTSSMAAHSDGDNVYWIQYDIWIGYGNASMTAPVQDESEKPILDLANTTSTSWKWLEFYDITHLRPGEWKPLIKRGIAPKVYTGSHLATADPATEMGLSGYSYYQHGLPRADTFLLYWQIYEPAGFTTISINGDKYRANLDWPAGTAIEKSLNGINWVNVYTIPTPTAQGAWQAWSVTSLALGGTYPYVRLVHAGNVKAKANNAVHVEAQTATFVLNSSNVPQLIFAGAEQGIYELDCRLKNVTTGEWLDIQGTMELNQELKVDTDAKTVTYLQDNSPAENFLTFPRRGEWLALDPALGANQLKFTDAGTSGVTISIEYQDRNT